jgi:hypothetical protein
LRAWKKPTSFRVAFIRLPAGVPGLNLKFRNGSATVPHAAASYLFARCQESFTEKQAVVRRRLANPISTYRPSEANMLPTHKDPYKFRHCPEAVHENLLELFRSKIAEHNGNRLKKVRIAKRAEVYYDPPWATNCGRVRLFHQGFEFVANLRIGIDLRLPLTILTPEMLRAIPADAVEKILWRMRKPTHWGAKR